MTAGPNPLWRCTISFKEPGHFHYEEQTSFLQTLYDHIKNVMRACSLLISCACDYREP